MKLLIIDGDILLSKIMALTFTQAGYIVEIAHDGNLALEKVQHAKIDIIITDLILPGMDGVNLLNHLRNELKLSIPVLVYTGIVEAETKQQAIAAGATGFLYKPTDSTTLLEKVKEMEDLL